MPIISKQNFLEPFTILLREGTTSDPYVDITETIKLVPNIDFEAAVYNIAILREIPLLTQGVTAIVNGKNLIEIRDSLTEIDDNHFKVDYTNGRVYLSKIYKDAEVTFGYKGRGAILVSSERILLSYGEDINNLYTLDEYVQEHMGEVNIGDLRNLKTNAKDKIVNAINEVFDKINNHIIVNDNPHNVTKAQVGLGNVDNTSDTQKPVSTPQQTALNTLETSIRNDMDVSDENLQLQINALSGAYVYIGSIYEDTQDITQELLNNRAKEITGEDTLQRGWVLLDNEKHEWYYNGSNWIDLEQSNIYPATNNTLGIVKGNSNVSIIDGLMTIELAKNSTNLNGNPSSYYGTSAEVNGKVSKSGDTMTGKLTFSNSSLSNASLNIPLGENPTSPGNGDLWMNSNGLNIRRNNSNLLLFDESNALTANLTTISQSDAEAGLSTTVRGWTAQRVNQSIEAQSWSKKQLIVGTVEPEPVTGKTILWIDMN